MSPQVYTNACRSANRSQGGNDSYYYSTGDFISDDSGSRSLWGYGWMITPDSINWYTGMGWVHQ